MARLGKSRRSPIGVDVGTRAVKAVQLERSAHGWRVAAAAVVPRVSPVAPDGVDRSQAAVPAGLSFGADPAVPSVSELHRLSDTLDRQGFSGSRVVLAVPDSKLLNSVLEVPARGAQVAVEQIVRAEMARAQKRSADSFEMAWWDLPAAARASRGSKVMAVGCGHADAAPLLDGFEAAGFDVAALDVKACALARACAPAAAAPPGITAILDLGWSSAWLALLHEGALVYGRGLNESGLSRLHSALRVKLKLDEEVIDYLLGDAGLLPGAAEEPGGAAAAAAADEDAVDFDVPADARAAVAAHLDGCGRELAASFSYAVHQYADTVVSRLLLTGGGGTIPGLSRQLEARLGVEVVALGPLALVECPTALSAACRSPALTAALGLAQFPEL